MPQQCCTSTNSVINSPAHPHFLKLNTFMKLSRFQFSRQEDSFLPSQKKLNDKNNKVTIRYFRLKIIIYTIVYIQKHCIQYKTPIMNKLKCWVFYLESLGDMVRKYQNLLTTSGTLDVIYAAMLRSMKRAYVRFYCL